MNTNKLKKETVELSNNLQHENGSTDKDLLKKSAFTRIMESRNETKHMALEKEGRVMIEYNRDNFFIEDNPNGFLSKTDFVHLFEKVLMTFEIKGFLLFLQQISERIRLEIPPISQPWSVTKREYYKVTYGSTTVTSKYQLVKLPFTEKLVMFYTFDMATFNLNFDELYDYAKSKL